MRFVTLLALLVAALPARTFASQDALLYANCPREAGEYVGTYRGHILLARAFLTGDEAALINASIEQQLRYFWGHYRNDAAAHAALQVSLSSEPSEIKIISRHEQAYGRDLALPYRVTEAKLALDDPYTQRAVARGYVKATDPALLIEYEIRFKLALCGRGEDPKSKIRAPLPLDPWLAYWYVPVAAHRPLRYHSVRAVTNPCADNDFADLPHPFYYWYDWQPNRHGPDDDGRLFDCRPLFGAGRDFDFFDIALERSFAPTADFTSLKKVFTASAAPIAATIVVGITDHAVTEPTLAKWAPIFGASGAFDARARDARRQFAASPKREGGTESFLGVLDELSQIMTVTSNSAALDEDGNLRVALAGKLARSGRAMNVRLYLGLTDIFGPRPPRHWQILRRAIAHDDVVIYWGHSGIGENFRLAQIEKQLNVSHETLAAELLASPLKLVAFLSCYSYMYFGRDLMAASALRDRSAYFVFTGMEHSRHEAGPLAVLDLIDRVLASDSGRIGKLPLLNDDEFWLVKELGPKR